MVTTDPELDDSNSLIRYLLYSTDFRTEGLIYPSSQFHWKGDGTGKKWFVAVDLYERVYPNLRVHDAGYPPPADLRSTIRWGNVEFDGDISKDSPGSDLIRRLLLDRAGAQVDSGTLRTRWNVAYGAITRASAENKRFFDVDWTRASPIRPRASCARKATWCGWPRARRASSWARATRSRSST